MPASIDKEFLCCSTENSFTVMPSAIRNMKFWRFDHSRRSVGYVKISGKKREYSTFFKTNSISQQWVTMDQWSYNGATESQIDFLCVGEVLGRARGVVDLGQGDA